MADRHGGLNNMLESSTVPDVALRTISENLRSQRFSPLADAKFVVIVVSYQGRPYLPECLDSLAKSQEAEATHVIVVDNASSDGSAEWVRSEFPEVTVLGMGANLGFAAANNRGWEFAQREAAEAQYIFLLNQDTIVEPSALVALVDYLDAHAEVGAVQAKLLLHPETDRVNTLGNDLHYLGFGLPSAYRELDDGRFETPQAITYPSGAAVLIRASVLRDLGLFEDAMFMYLEDADLGCKLRQAGYEVHVVPAARVYHKYRFNRGFRFYYELERNRWWLLLVYYRWRTLLLLLPAITFMEAGQWIFALSRGLATAKLRSYAFFWRPSNLRMILGLRRQARERRKLSDREFLSQSLGKIESPELTSPLLRYVANPLLAAYWAVARRLLWW
jgi:GT2 family glycosyltransferase